MTSRPAVLCFSGHDPTGGAGIQADIEAIISHQCHPLSIITALTDQDTGNIKTLTPQHPEEIIKQSQTLIADIPIKAIKIGLIGNPDTVQAIHHILKIQTSIPIVFDPVLAAGGGKPVSDDDLINQITKLILPFIKVLTPNSLEAQRLTGMTDLKSCGLKLLEMGCDYALITGTHEATEDVINQLFHNGKLVQTYSWKRLPYNYHGSGCTLAASIAALLAKDLSMNDAVSKAQEYTWQTLSNGFQPGKAQHIPNRLYWAETK